MSLVRWLEESNETDPAIVAADKEVEKAKNQRQRRKRGNYFHYDGETRAKIAKYSCEKGNKAAVSKFSAELGHIVKESTVRNMKKAYLTMLKSEKDPDKIQSLPYAARGRPLLLRDYDRDVASYIKSLRAAGGIVNRSIYTAYA